MASYDWKDIVDRLNAKLHLMAAPVGMKWVRTEDELNAIPKIRIQKNRFAPCVAVGQAVQFGWTTACKKENVHMDYCRGIHGMFERDEKWYSAGFFAHVWQDDEAGAMAHHRALNCVPAEYVAIAVSPLSAGRIEAPDVCVLHMSSAQAFMLLAGYQYTGYQQLDFTFSGESTCSDSWTRTFLTGKPSVALPSFADRKFGACGEWELRVTMTPEDLVKALDGVEALSKNGLRYPIASYSLTTDMMAGLPPQYSGY